MEGALTLSGYTEDGERVPLALLGFEEAIDLAERLNRLDRSGLPDGEWVVGAPWFPDADDIRDAAEALVRRMPPAGDPWATSAGDRAGS